MSGTQQDRLAIVYTTNSIQSHEFSITAKCGLCDLYTKHSGPRLDLNRINQIFQTESSVALHVLCVRIALSLSHKRVGQGLVCSS